MIATSGAGADAAGGTPALTDDGARVLVGQPIAEAIREEASTLLAESLLASQPTPGVAVVLVGDDGPSRVYAGRILRNADAVGTWGRLVEMPAETTADHLRDVIGGLNADAEIGGIIVQMPLPPHLQPREVITALDPLKDIDGIHPLNAGLAALGYRSFVPSCAEAAVEVLKRSGYRLAGRRVVVVGRSSVVGRPVALLLLRENATVTLCHRQTLDLPAELARAEIVVAAAGAPGLITGDMLRPGTVVIDCGINVVDGGLVGDVESASVRSVAAALSPVPGGVGPVTNAVLMHHFARAVRAQREGGFGDVRLHSIEPRSGTPAG